MKSAFFYIADINFADKKFQISAHLPIFLTEFISILGNGNTVDETFYFAQSKNQSDHQNV